MRRSSLALLLPTLWMAAAWVAACEPAVPEELRADSVLQAELGLSDDDVVHTLAVTGGDTEVVQPAELVIAPGEYVEFVSEDFRVHEIRFDLESMSGPERSFLVDSGQVDAPPMVDRGDRFVVRFDEAPDGRYPFVIEGNGAPVRGVVIVRSNP